MPLRPPAAFVLASFLALAACGGGGEDPSLPQRTLAVNETVARNPDCSTEALGSYYWEIGDAGGRIASGSVGSGAPDAATTMRVASASKWIYAAYVAQKRRGALDAAADRPFLNFTSGYTGFGLPRCPTGAATVAACLEGGRDAFDEDDVGRFAYDSGHMQNHAAGRMDLGDRTTTTLADEIGDTLRVELAYVSVQLAAGVQTTPAAYAGLLRRMLRGGDLAIGPLLGTGAVCASTGGCPDGPAAIDSPQSQRIWHYAMGHWIEDDPAHGDDGAYSSAGGLGFYPWVAADRALYGLLAREADADGEQEGFKSALCGGAIRQAWTTGVARTGD